MYIFEVGIELILHGRLWLALSFVARLPTMPHVPHQRHVFAKTWTISIGPDVPGGWTEEWV